MNRGLLLKALRETWPITLLLGAGLALAEMGLAYAYLKFEDQISNVLLQIRFAQQFLKTLLGSDLTGQIGPEMLTALAWVHPVMLALVWAHAIIWCTRVPAGEVDRGTIDVLLGLPISRWQLYCSETLLWLFCGAAVLLLGAAGNILGGWILTGGLRTGPGRLAVVLLNLFCLYLAVGGLAWLASALSDRRGRAIGVVFSLLLASFLLNYLAQFWSLADRLVFLTPLQYYKPLLILRDGVLPVGDMSALLGFAVLCWTAGGLIFARRDISTL